MEKSREKLSFEPLPSRIGEVIQKVRFRAPFLKKVDRSLSHQTTVRLVVVASCGEVFCARYV